MSKKKSQSQLPLVLGVACLAVLAGLIFYYTQYSRQEAVSDQLREGLRLISEAAESGLAEDDILGPEADLSGMVAVLTATVAQRVSERDNARAELAQERTTSERLRGERDVAQQQIRDNRSQADELDGRLTTARNELAQLRQQHADELEQLRNQQAEEVQGLREETARLRSRLRETQVHLPEDEIEIEDEPEPADEADRPLERDPEMTSIPLDESELFAKMHYDAEMNRLSLVTRDNRTLVYSEVPPEIYEGLMEARSIDIYYRVHILLNYPCSPDDLGVIRSIRR